MLFRRAFTAAPGTALIRSLSVSLSVSPLLSLLLAASVMACNGTTDPFEGFVSRSEFFEYHDESSVPQCPTLLEQLDRHAQAFGELIGLTPTRDEPFRYYRFVDWHRLQDECRSKNADGCAPGDVVYSITPFRAHELAHAYVYRAWGGQSVGLLEEGEAVALTCDGGADTYVGHFGDWRNELYMESDRAGYTQAAFLVNLLAKRFGWPKVGELHRRVPPGTSVTDFEREFANVYPMSMDQAWADAASELDRDGAYCSPPPREYQEFLRKHSCAEWWRQHEYSFAIAWPGVVESSPVPTFRRPSSSSSR